MLLSRNLAITPIGSNRSQVTFPVPTVRKTHENERGAGQPGHLHKVRVSIHMACIFLSNTGADTLISYVAQAVRDA